MFTRFLRSTIAIALAWFLSASGGEALAALKDKGPLNQFGFPSWYRDTNRLALQQCVTNIISPDPGAAGGYMCAVTLTPPPPGTPAQVPPFDPALAVSSTLTAISGGQAFSNWPLEAFYFQASAPKTFSIVNSKKTLIEFGLESSFSGASPVPGSQIVFSRVRISLLQVPQGTYTIRHPYGVETVTTVADGKGGFEVFNYTRDIGLADPVPFAGALNGDIGPFLHWTVENPRVYAAGNPNVALGPDGFISITLPGGAIEKFVGDPSIDHTFSGSPIGYNKIRIEGPAGSVINPDTLALDRSVMETDLITIEGRVWTTPIPTPVVVNRASYSRSAAGGQVDLFATSDATSNLGTPSTLTATYAGLAAPVVLAKTTSGATASFFSSLPLTAPAQPPATVTLTNTADQVALPASPLAVDAAVVDEVRITRAAYDPRTRTLTINAASSDQLVPPALVANGFGPLVSGALTVAALDIYPPKVTVVSAAGGVAAAAVEVRETVPVSASAGAAGAIFPSGSVAVVRGEGQTFRIVAEPGFRVGDVLVDSASQGAITSYTFNGVIVPHTISATFVADTYTITASAGTGGSITPSGSAVLQPGDSASYTITVNPGYVIGDVLVDGVSVGTPASYVFTAISANHTIAVSFLPIASAPAYLNLQTTNGLSVYLISAPSSAVGANYHFEHSLDNGVTWTAFTGLNTLVRNPTLTLPGPGVYLFRVYVTASGYAPSSYTLTTTPYDASTALAPAYLNIQSANTLTGSIYLISAPSATPGAVYNFQVNDGTGWVNIGTPSAVRNPTFNLLTGTYQFRVFITATGFSPSAFTTTVGTATIAIPAKAPNALNIQTFSDLSKSVYLIAAASATAGAVYNFQYSTDNGANWANIGTPSATRNPTFTLLAPGTYKFRVFVTAPGYVASPFTTTVGSAAVTSALAAPAYLNIQATFPASGQVYLISAPSATVTPGLRYVFEYKEALAPTWTALAPNAARNPTIQLPAPGTYSFRVKVTDVLGVYVTDSAYSNAAGTFTY